MERASRVKANWRWGAISCWSLGLLALIPLMDYRTFWPWVPFSSVILWVIGGILYYVGLRVTSKPLRRPRIK